MSKTNGMKKALKFILPLLAVIITVAGVWAMRNTHRMSQKFNAPYYYHYKANVANLSAYQTQTNWEAVQSPGEPGCDGTDLPCVVKSTQPTLSSFVNSITQESDVTSNTVAQKNQE